MSHVFTKKDLSLILKNFNRLGISDAEDLCKIIGKSFHNLAFLDKMHSIAVGIGNHRQRRNLLEQEYFTAKDKVQEQTNHVIIFKKYLEQTQILCLLLPEGSIFFFFCV